MRLFQMPGVFHSVMPQAVVWFVFLFIKAVFPQELGCAYRLKWTPNFGQVPKL